MNSIKIVVLTLLVTSMAHASAGHLNNSGLGLMVSKSSANNACQREGNQARISACEAGVQFAYNYASEKTDPASVYDYLDDSTFTLYATCNEAYFAALHPLLYNSCVNGENYFKAETK